MIDILPVISSVLVLLGYSLFAGLLLFRGRLRPAPLLMAVASGLTALWALAILLGREDLLPIAMVYQANALKDVGWLAAMLAMVRRTPQPASSWRILLGSCLFLIAAHLTLSLGNIDLGNFAGVGIDAKLSG